MFWFFLVFFLGGDYASMEAIDVKHTIYETLLPLMTTFITFPQIFLLAQSLSKC